MIIFLPIKLSSTGGTSTFARKFQTGAAERGHTVIFEATQEYEVLLVPATCPLPILYDAWRRKRPIIQRLDGVYYPATVVGWQYPLHNFPLWFIRKFLAKQIIYQSTFSQASAQKWLGETERLAQVIYNGVDTDHFTPDGPAEKLQESPDQPVFITWSRFRRPDQILPQIAVLRAYRRTYDPRAKLVVVGNFEGRVTSVPQQFKDEPGVEFRGAVANSDLPTVARGADIFLFTHQNPPCPNNVLEAMACGLPICGVADGAMPELTTSGYNSELVPVAEAGWYTARQLDPRALADNLNLIMKDRSRYALASRATAIERFSLDHMVRRYLNILEAAIQL